MPPVSKPRRVVIYCRLSVSAEESVSIARQEEAGRQYAAARGWDVVDVFVDDGVSAAKIAPESRRGWQALMAAAGTFDVVLTWKLDRLARNVRDFVNTDAELQQYGAAVACVEQSIDMTTPEGRAFAVVLAAFAELEAAQIAARIKATRTHLLHNGRRPGGRTTFGWMNVANPDGPGKVLAQDPERIGLVSEAAARIMRGESLYGVTQWLNLQGVAPRGWRPRRGQDPDRPHVWYDASLDATLRSPAMYGAVAYHGDLVRDADGLPVIDESIAILAPAEHALLVARLDAARTSTPQPRQRAGSLLMHGIAKCAECGENLHRNSNNPAWKKGAPNVTYSCSNPRCTARRVTCSAEGLEKYVIGLVLAERGDAKVIDVTDEVAGADLPALAELQAAIEATSAELAAADEADERLLLERLRVLKADRARAREAGPTRQLVSVSSQTVAEAWEAAGEDMEARRAVLARELTAVRVSKPVRPTGPRFDGPGRVTPEWRQLAPTEIATAQRAGVLAIAEQMMRAQYDIDNPKPGAREGFERDWGPHVGEPFEPWEIAEVEREMEAADPDWDGV